MLDSDWVEQKHDLHKNKIGWKIAFAPTNEISYTTYRVLGVCQVCKNGLKINESGFNRTTEEKNSVAPVECKTRSETTSFITTFNKKKGITPALVGAS
jgi:hypothetical protein